MGQRPYLYHWLMGRLLALCPFTGADALVFLRVVNVGLSLLTLMFAQRAVALFATSPVERLVFLLMLTNTLMFTFLSASVSYDNLANLLAALSFCSLFGYCRDRDPVSGV